MTGKDLLDAVGYVDERLLERCQQREQTKSENQISYRNKIFWFWYEKKYISIVFYTCLLVVFILGIAYWQYDFGNIGESLVNGSFQGITASLDIDRSQNTQRLPKADKQNNTDSNLTEDTQNEPEINNSSHLLDDSYQPDSGSLPDINDSSDQESVLDATPNSGNADMLPSSDTQIAKDNNTDNISLNYSYGIKIETVKEIPERKPPSETSSPPSEPISPEEIPSVKRILAGNTAIIRGTVKKIRHLHVSDKELDIYFSVVSLKVKEVYRPDRKGNPQKGSICKILLPDTKASSYFESSILGKIVKGSEAIMMPYIADSQTGIRKKGTFFAYIDVSDYYFDETTAESHLFLKTKTGVLYDTKIYNIHYSGKKATLDDIGEYLKKML